MQKRNNQSKEELLINNIDQKLPPIRHGVEMIPIKHEDKEMIYFHDPEGYLVKPFLLDKQIGALMPLLNGAFSVREIKEELQRYGSKLETEKILHFIRQLDDARLLQSPWFRSYKKQVEEKFEISRNRPPVCSGQSYPSTKEDLRIMLDQAFSTNGSGNIKKSKIKGLFAPHIDPRIGLKSYVPAFNPLKTIRPKRVILLATSHYSGMYDPIYRGKPFIATRKNFETPLGVVQTDQETMDMLERTSEQTGISFQDRAHRNEHSIELHLIFLQYFWSHAFSIVPILVGSLDELYYMEDGDIGKKLNKMASLLSSSFADDDETIFLISGDLAHVGHKFGDKQPASDKFEKVREFDHLFMETAVRADTASMLELMKQDYDPFRICGFPPLITALKALNHVRGSVTSYELWDEREQESAVTFGSILYQETY